MRVTINNKNLVEDAINFIKNNNINSNCELEYDDTFDRVFIKGDKYISGNAYRINITLEALKKED